MKNRPMVAYCTGFWCTNIGNAFFALGVEYVLKKLLGADHVTVVSDLQTYTNSVGKRLFVHPNQFEYISALDVDYVVLAGPVLSRYFLSLWGPILKKLHQRGIGYIILSAGMMKIDEASKKELQQFFREYPPYILTTRERASYREFGSLATHGYDGVCFSFFIPDLYTPASLSGIAPYIVCNFDKIMEPMITETKPGDSSEGNNSFLYQGMRWQLTYNKLVTRFMGKTDRFSDALIYFFSLLPGKTLPKKIGERTIVRTDHRFHPHYRTKIYRQPNSFCADVPYGYLNLYANSELTMSDRVHACAVTLAYGNYAMLFADTNREGLLDRVGAAEIKEHPVKLDLAQLTEEKNKLLAWLDERLQ